MSTAARRLVSYGAVTTVDNPLSSVFSVSLSHISFFAPVEILDSSLFSVSPFAFAILSILLLFRTRSSDHCKGIPGAEESSSELEPDSI